MEHHSILRAPNRTSLSSSSSFLCSRTIADGVYSSKHTKCRTTSLWRRVGCCSILDAIQSIFSEHIADGATLRPCQTPLDSSTIPMIFKTIIVHAAPGITATACELPSDRNIVSTEATLTSGAIPSENTSGLRKCSNLYDVVAFHFPPEWVGSPFFLARGASRPLFNQRKRSGLLGIWHASLKICIYLETNTH
jgi:hypothetical protein